MMGTSALKPLAQEQLRMFRRTLGPNQGASQVKLPTEAEQTVKQHEVTWTETSTGPRGITWTFSYRGLSTDPNAQRDLDESMRQKSHAWNLVVTQRLVTLVAGLAELALLSGTTPAIYAFSGAFSIPDLLGGAAVFGAGGVFSYILQRKYYAPIRAKLNRLIANLAHVEQVRS